MWSKWMLREYKKRAKCMMQAYGQKLGPGAEISKKDYEIVDENMADNGKFWSFLVKFDEII
jgi:hypothetical protein